MKKVILLCFFTIALSVSYLSFKPTSIEPVAWQAPKDLGYSGAFFQNQQLSQVNRIEIANDLGPEDLALDRNGKIYFSLASGSIKTMTSDHKIEEWVSTGGRPLGIEFDNQGNLIVADAYMGLLSITHDGKITQLVTSVEDQEVNFADDVDIASNGKIYFTDASSKFKAKEYGTFEASLLDIMEHGGHGRLIEYDPHTKQSHVLAKNLNFANGVSLSHDENYVFVNETGSYRIIKVKLEGPNRGTIETVIDNLPGFPDNISRGSDDQYWIGLAAPRNKPLDLLSNQPYLRRLVQALPKFLQPKEKRFGHVFSINSSGDVIHNFQDPLGMYGYTTGALEVGDKLFISSLHEAALAVTVNPNF